VRACRRTSREKAKSLEGHGDIVEPRIGILRVTVAPSGMGAKAEGQLTVQEWLLALELTKARLLASVQQKSPIEMIPRRVDRKEEED